MSRARENESTFGATANSKVLQRRAIFTRLETAPALLLAVSGGPDSLALMLLAARWAESLGPSAPDLHVATVDHGLRAASGAEAEAVAVAAARFGFPHTTLPWLGPKPRTRIQERAREARYAMLSAHARAIGATHLLTAHHADDQAETVLFRLGRGSGIGGLAGMRRETPLGTGLTLARPLLDCRKNELVALCGAAGLAVIDDPSNRDPAYARARLRALGPEAARLGLDTPTLVRLAARMARADDALEAEAARWMHTLGPCVAAGRFEARLAPMAGVEAEILTRVLRRALTLVSPTARPPRLDRLESLAAAIRAAISLGQAYRGTLAGTRVILRRDTMLIISIEAERRRGRPPIEGI